MKTRKNILNIPVIKGKVLGVDVYRGYAKLCDLSRISKADVYDQIKNPKGTQRDLKPKHARNAYEYVKNRDFAFWPEVFLCTRDKSVVSFCEEQKQSNIGILSIDLNLACKPKSVAISRVDGNHRLHFVDGALPGYQAIEKTVSFCLAYNLTREQEIVLFKDINNNQKKMDTSHLDNIEVRLTPEEELKHKTPDLFIAQELGRDSKSAFYKRIYEGGKRNSGIDIPLRSLRTGIEYMLSRSTQLPHIDIDAQYKVIRNYFNAVEKWQPKAWSKPKEYIILRGVGLWAMCFMGSYVIDTMLLQGKVGTKDMVIFLKSGKLWDWTSSGDFKGYSGRSGALEISKKVVSKLHNQNKISSTELFKLIMESE